MKDCMGALIAVGSRVVTYTHRHWARYGRVISIDTALSEAVVRIEHDQAEVTIHRSNLEVKEAA